MSQFTKRAFVTWSALTHTTERATRRRGARYFLPALFVDRFANLGGIDKDLFTRQLDACRSFEDEQWASYWRGIAEGHLAAADRALTALGAPGTAVLLGGEDDLLVELGRQLAPAVNVFANRTPENAEGLVAEFSRNHPSEANAAVAIDELVKAMVYLFAACWPGWTPHRMSAYGDSQRIFHVLLCALAPAMDVHAERIELDLAGEKVVAYGIFPTSHDQCATLLVTNGLEGTIQEALVPALRHRDRGVAIVTMEMPGTFQYDRALSPDSEAIYTAMIDQLSNHPRVDAARIGMLGLSFGAHWSTRMAARDTRLRAVVSNGGLYHRSFAAPATFGMPQIMLWTLKKSVGARNLMELGRKLHALSIKHLYSQVQTPLLVINGDSDSLISSQDSIDLANAAPHAELVLYADDDHCAMGHYTEWLDLSTEWIQERLQPR